MLDLSLPARIVKNDKKLLIKEVLFNNDEYALVKIETDLTEIHSDIATIVISPNELDQDGYTSGYNKIISKKFNYFHAENYIKDKDEKSLKEMFKKIYVSNKVDIKDKDKLLQEIITDLNHKGIVVHPDSENPYKKILVKYIDNINYEYINEDIDDCINYLESFSSKNHEILNPLYNLILEAMRERNRYAMLRIFVSSNRKDNSIKIRCPLYNGSLVLGLGKNKNFKKEDLEKSFPMTKFIRNYKKFKKILIDADDKIFV